MKRIILLIVFVLALSVSAWGQSTNRIILHSGATSAANGERPFGLSWNGGTITVSGTFTGLNAVAEISPDGSLFNTISVTNLNGLTQSAAITAAGVYFMPIGRAYQFGVRVTAVTGTATIVITPTDQVLAKGGGAPADATFITQTPSSTLSAEQALSSLATGLLKNTTATGVLSIAGAGDLPTGIDAAKLADGSVSNAEFQRLDGVTSGIQAQIDGKQAALGFTPENVANKSTDGTMAGNSDTLYPSQKATKTYADTKVNSVGVTSPITTTGGLTPTIACATCLVSGGSLFTLNAGSGTGLTVPGAVAQGATVTVGSNADALMFGSLALGFGSTTPPSGPTLNVVSTISTSPRGIASMQFSTDTNGARVGFFKARGTVASPTTIVTGDTLGRLMFRGYDGTGYLEMGSIEVVSTDTIATNRVPTNVVISTATNAAPSVLTEAVRFKEDQSIVQTSASATAFESGPNGSTNPTFRLVNNISSAVTGLSVTGNAAGAGVTLTAISSGSNEGITLTPKGGATNLTVTGMFKMDTASFGASDPIFYNTSLASPTTNYAFTQNSSGSTVFNGSAVDFRLGNTTKLSLQSGGIIGGAGNMTITAGTGNSRTMVLQTTTSGGAATTALTLGADQSAAFAGDIAFTKTITTAGTTGAQTINKTSGTVNFAAAATSLVVTNSLVGVNSIITLQVACNDTTMKSVSYVSASGSFTIYSNAAATAECRVDFRISN